MSNSEQGIFQAQAQAASEQLGNRDGLRRLQASNVIYLDERIYVYLLAIAMLGLCLVWVTWSSNLVFYGSLVVVILLTCLWGLARIRRIDRVRHDRQLQARLFAASKAERREIE